ncbi:hypothetical protein ANN_23405 [Periplaneta americana]|uniref:Uncharacterized protein n=1 Tax=Periplaneta americana TaxID=6978 RepID=A0ABQ8SL03_PERAM|nr:hypothetical protein ANN_23405 [Periplaneta americana]
MGYFFALEYDIRKALDNTEGLELIGLHHLLDYADDENMLGENPHTIRENMGIVLEASKAIGLELCSRNEEEEEVGEGKRGSREENEKRRKDPTPVVHTPASFKPLRFPWSVVTCLAHALNRVAEEVCANFPEVDKLIGCVKKVFLKAPSRISAFKTEAPEIQLPFSPVLTRWGTWLQACSYYCKNFDVVKKVVDSFDNGESVSIKKAQELLADKEIAGKLSYINTNFGFLPVVITALEKSQVTLVQQLQIVDKVVNDLSRACGKVGDAVSMKIKNCLSKNRGYTTLCSMAELCLVKIFLFLTVS